MLRNNKFNRIAIAVAMSVGLSSAAMAQDTASSVRGSLVSETGNAVTDAKITITHEPSGTTKVLSTNDSGSFFAQGLRVGGPYTITIDSDVYQDKTLQNVFITLGEVFRISEVLENGDIERISVTGSAQIVDYAAGSNSVFSGDTLSDTSSFNRDLKDIVRLNPLAVVGNDGVSLYLGGSNPRYNSLKVDGVNLNDDFGLAGNGYPTERSPIAFDSVEQISVAIAPFSAKEGGFSGGQISVVTKSGTNEFHGSAFFEQAKDSWAGTPENPFTGRDVELSFKEESYGATLGGAIVEDTLFFFASYETFEAPSSVSKGVLGSGAANETSNISQDDVDRVVTAAQNLFDYDAGDWNASIPLEDEKYSLKLDWNINDDHRASFAYSHAFSNSAGNVGSGASDELYLSSHWYNRSNEIDSYVAQVFSYWTDEFSTEFKMSYKESVNGQVPLGGLEFGEVKVTHNNGLINFGPDDSRHANQLTNETLQLRASGEYLLNDHAISFGWEYESVDVYNIFMQHYLGSWYFNSIEDLEAANANFFEYQNNPSLNRDEAAASFSLANHAFYVEDSWDISDSLNIVYGLRYEVISNEDVPNENALFVERHNFTNTENMDGKDLILPRFGFTWLASDDLTVRGGFGLFSGGKPNVWISNSFTNDGSRIALFRSSSDDAFLDNADPNSIPQAALDAISNASLDGAFSNIDATDPNFEIPSVWQYSLAADYMADLSSIGLGADWFVSAEVLYKDHKNDPLWTDITRQIDVSRGNNGYTVDGRPIYTFAFDSNNEAYDPTSGESARESRDVLLTNIDGGTSIISTFTLAKYWDNGVNMNFSYANQNIEDRFSASGTSTDTSYQFHPTIDPQNPEIGTSSYETEHKLSLNLSYKTQYFDGYDTTFSAFWQRKSARPYSWQLSQNRSDTGFSGALDLNAAYLPYVPTGADDAAVDFTNGMSYNEIVEQLEAVGISTEGGIVSKNQFRGPWNSTLDLKIQQQIPGLFDGHKGIFYVDLKNALAIIDKDSGVVFNNPFGNSSSNLFSYSINDAGQYVYSSNDVSAGDSPIRFRDRDSTWSVKVGVKYTF
ncbi:TonB-dependent receptor [Paraglaciecola sp. L3A3]|uniref:TonB-dependent receptor n=1 Tax=Paraglaciecola sp. L3A3 TaxID=2686358 RepID=UPI00131B5C95|nr:TonB-dependent receptor [Paraglaciecola sp. L3A3]